MNCALVRKKFLEAKKVSEENRQNARHASIYDLPEGGFLVVLCRTLWERQKIHNYHYASTYDEAATIAERHRDAD